MKKLKSNKGLSLIVLVITIIVLIVLAGVAIASLTRNDNIVKRSQEAKTEHESSQENEIVKLDGYETKIAESEKGESGSTENIWKKRGLTSPNVSFDKRYEGNMFGGGDWIIIQSDGSLLSSWANLEPAKTLDNYIKDGKWIITSDYVWNGEGSILELFQEN